MSDDIREFVDVLEFLERAPGYERAAFVIHFTNPREDEVHARLERWAHASGQKPLVAMDTTCLPIFYHGQFEMGYDLIPRLDGKALAGIPSKVQEQALAAYVLANVHAFRGETDKPVSVFSFKETKTALGTINHGHRIFSQSDLETLAGDRESGALHPNLSYFSEELQARTDSQD